MTESTQQKAMAMAYLHSFWRAIDILDEIEEARKTSDENPDSKAQIEELTSECVSEIIMAAVLLRSVAAFPGPGMPLPEHSDNQAPEEV